MTKMYLSTIRHLRIVFTTLILTVVTLSSQPVAASSFEYAGSYNGSQYYYSRTRMTWPEAKAEAEAAGGHLVTIQDATENTIIKSIASDTLAEDVWIGFSDAAVNGTYRWVTGELLSAGYLNWDTGEPSNGLGTHYGILRKNNGSWGNDPSSASRYAVAEMHNAAVPSNSLWLRRGTDNSFSSSGGYSQVANIALSEYGFSAVVGDNNLPLSSHTLSDYKMIVFPLWDVDNQSTSDIDALRIYVFNGGCVLFLGDMQGDYNNPNNLLDEFDIHCLDGGDTFLDEIFSSSHPITSSISQLGLHSSVSFSLNSGIPQALGKDIDGNIILVAGRYGLGKVVAYAESAIFLNSGAPPPTWGDISTPDHARFARNVFAWFTSPEAVDPFKYIKITECVNGSIIEKATATGTIEGDKDVTVIARGSNYHLLVDNVQYATWSGFVPVGPLRVGMGVDYDGSASVGGAQIDNASLSVFNHAPALTDIPDITIPESGSDSTVDLDQYVADDYTPDASMAWNVNGQPTGTWFGSGVRCFIDIASRVVTFAAEPGFTGKRAFTFTAADEYGKVASDDVVVTVLASDTHQFSNISVIAGITDVLSGLGVAFGDYNRDGLQDILLANGMSTAGRLLRNLGNNQFADVTAPSGLSSASDTRTALWGDVDNDGWRDVLFINNGSSCQLFHNNGAGTFTDVSVTSGISTIVGNGRCGAFVDYDLDSDLDIFVTFQGRPCALFRNDGTVFAEVASSIGLDVMDAINGCAFGDYDLDGDQDLYLAVNGSNRLYENRRTSGFSEALTAGVWDARNSQGASWDDINNDGYPDLYVTNAGPGNTRDTLYLNQQNGTFLDVTSLFGAGNLGTAFGSAFSDYDADGWSDLFAANALSPDILLKNLEGTGVIDDATLAGVLGSAAEVARGAAFADIDNDGDSDLYVVNSSGQPDVLYRNNGHGNKWLTVRLIGKVSNRDAIGARVSIKCGTSTYSKEVNGGSGYRSQDDLPLEFGLGQNQTVDRLTIQWPSGMVQELSEIASDQILTVTEEFQVAAIYLMPSGVIIPPSASIAFEAYGMSPSGATQTLDPKSLYWEVADPQVAALVADGTFIGLQEGQTHVTASLGAIQSSAADLRVAVWKVTSLAISPVSAKLAVGEKTPFSALASFDDGSVQDYTHFVDWLTTNRAMAPIGLGGLLQANSIGTATIQANYGGVSSNEAIVQIIGSGQTALRIDPPAMVLDLGPGPINGQFSAWKSFTDGSGSPEVDVTNQVIWQPADPFVATVDAFGQATAKKAGNTSLIARMGTTSSTSASLTVNLSLPEITVSPTTIAFGSRDTGTGPTPPHAIRVNNTTTGIANLVFTGPGLSLTGVNPGEFAFSGTPSLLPISPGSYRDFQIVFEPHSTGWKRATVIITTNDVDEGTIQIDMDGYGVSGTSVKGWNMQR